jgi:hypothetical protein
VDPGKRRYSPKTRPIVQTVTIPSKIIANTLMIAPDMIAPSRAMVSRHHDLIVALAVQKAKAHGKRRQSLEAIK